MICSTRSTTVMPLAALLFATITSTQADLSAQSTVQGFSVGAHGVLTPIVDDASPSASAVSLILGYGVSQHLSFHAATSGARIGATDTRDSYFQSFIDLESRITFGRTGSRLRPHLAVGASGRTDHEDQPEVEGDDPKLRTTIRPIAGGGLSYYLSPAFALDGAVRYTLGDDNRTRVMLGATWYPKGR